MEPCHTNWFENNWKFTYINNDNEGRKDGTSCGKFQMKVIFISNNVPFLHLIGSSILSFLPVTYYLLGTYVFCNSNDLYFKNPPNHFVIFLISYRDKWRKERKGKGERQDVKTCEESELTSYHGTDVWGHGRRYAISGPENKDFIINSNSVS